MQTTKWGPEGWILFHSVPFYYPDHNPCPATKARFKKFFSILQKILPCKYCRISYSEYWDKLDIDPYLKKGRKALFEWTYHLHNLVNNKLRSQGYLDKPDPSFDSVWKRYTQKLLYPTNNKNKRPIVDPRFWGEPAWDFISTIAFNYDATKPDLRKAYAEFFQLLGQILKPTEEYRRLLMELPPDLTSREHLTSWLHLFREILNERLGKVGKKYYPSYQQFHERYESRRAKCAKKTCRIPVNTTQRGAGGICKL